MYNQNPFYIDKLSTEELAFLELKIKKDRRLYDQILILLLAGAAIISFAGAWQNIPNPNKKTDVITIFSWENYFITLGALSCIFYLSILVLRKSGLSLMKKDANQKQKVIEKVKIEKRTYLPHNNTYHFYLNSIQKLSIEVNAQDFDNYNEGDEINIEYSKNAEIYFGYF